MPIFEKKEVDPKEKSSWKQFNEETSYTAAVTSNVKHVANGATMIAGVAKQIKNSSNSLVNVERFETFDQAVERLGINIKDIPLIHNQIVVQFYISFFVGVVAFALSVGYFIQSNFISAALATTIGISAFMLAMQSSVHAYQIKKRNLSIKDEWFNSPSDWFPSRLDGLERMGSRNPLRSPKLIRTLSRKSLIAWFFLALNIGIALPIFFLDQTSMSKSFAILPAAFAIPCLFFAVNYSFEVFKRKEGVHCDLGLWLLNPLEWIPVGDDKKIKDLEKYFEKSENLKILKNN